MDEYWSLRTNHLYYQAVLKIAAVVGRDAKNVLDIGSSNTSYIQWFSWIDRKVQLDLAFDGRLEGVERIEADFLNWRPAFAFDLVLCLQVLEHVPDVGEFCRRLKAVSKRLIVSVPYKWAAGRHREHVHDPVDKAKLKSWMSLSPNYALVVREPFGLARLISYYDLVEGEGFRIKRAEARKALRRARFC